MWIVKFWNGIIMTKQQFLDKLLYESDRVIYNSAGQIVEVGVAVWAYLMKQENDAIQQQTGKRDPNRDWLFFYTIRCKTKDKDGIYILGETVYDGYATKDTYAISNCSESNYKQFAADIGSVCTVGETGLTITHSTGKTYYIPYSDIEEIRGALMPSSVTINTFTPVGQRVHYSKKHIGFLGVTPAVNKMDLTHALRKVRQAEFIE